MDKKEMSFKSILKPYIESLIAEKNANGFIYKTEKLTLKRFDQYCVDKKLNTANITKEFLKDWCTQLTTEKTCGLAKRVGTVRQLLLHMFSLGISVYIPTEHFKKEIVLPHLFTDEEIIAYFKVVDAPLPDKKPRYLHRLANEFRVLFRMLYCCGLRNSEASTIKTENVDLEKGILTIINAKNRRDRLVYLPDDLRQLCIMYREYITQELGYLPEYFFPGMYPTKPIPNTSVDSKFNIYWKKTSFSQMCNNKPTVHDLRFSFITKRINEWVKANENIDNLMPYLSQYVGHSSISETYYYYHISKEFYKIVLQKDKTSSEVIPEVNMNENNQYCFL